MCPIALLQLAQNSSGLNFRNVFPSIDLRRMISLLLVCISRTSEAEVSKFGLISTFLI